MNENREQLPAVTARVKLMLCREDRFFGPGVCELLERIRETGSIQAAAARMEMSYTKAWRILKRAEEETGRHLITRTAGGKNGGSSSLTPEGRRAVNAFREMEQRLQKESERILSEYAALLPGSD